jgi:hypothetical protein
LAVTMLSMNSRAQFFQVNLSAWARQAPGADQRQADFGIGGTGKRAEFGLAGPCSQMDIGDEKRPIALRGIDGFHVASLGNGRSLSRRGQETIPVSAM